MSDLHTLPLRGRELPLAADLRRQVRAKARVWKDAAGWNWRHYCGEGWTFSYLISEYGIAVSEAVRHVKRCRG